MLVRRALVGHAGPVLASVLLSRLCLFSSAFVLFLSHPLFTAFTNVLLYLVQGLLAGRAHQNILMSISYVYAQDTSIFFSASSVVVVVDSPAVVGARFIMRLVRFMQSQRSFIDLSVGTRPTGST